MKIIELTDWDTKQTIYINPEHLVGFWTEKNVTYITGNNISGQVIETPGEIIKLIANAKEFKGE